MALHVNPAYITQQELHSAVTYLAKISLLSGYASTLDEQDAIISRVIQTVLVKELSRITDHMTAVIAYAIQQETFSLTTILENLENESKEDSFFPAFGKSMKKDLQNLLTELQFEPPASASVDFSTFGKDAS